MNSNRFGDDGSSLIMSNRFKIVAPKKNDALDTFADRAQIQLNRSSSN